MMRRFHSYGPVNCKRHFCVPRQAIIEHCIAELIGEPDEGGHYFTIWTPRQTGKTWLMRQILTEIPKHYQNYTAYSFSLGDLRGMSYTLSEQSGEIMRIARQTCCQKLE